MSAEQLANEVVRVLDVKVRRGVRQPEEAWIGFDRAAVAEWRRRRGRPGHRTAHQKSKSGYHAVSDY